MEVIILVFVCNMCTRDLPDMYALSPQASGIHTYISGKSLLPMLQLLHVSMYPFYVCLLVISYGIQVCTFEEMTEDFAKCQGWTGFFLTHIIHRTNLTHVRYSSTTTSHTRYIPRVAPRSFSRAECQNLPWKSIFTRDVTCKFT